jgi:hypothetical protein
MIRVEYVFNEGDAITIETDTTYSPDIVLDLTNRLLELIAHVQAARHADDDA